MLGRVHSIESFGSVDGPGVRFVIFLQGCPMRCQFCHNADTWDVTKGEMRSADELLDQAERYRPYWGKEGGITESGGEPLLQIDFLLELFKKAKEREIHTVIDTSGGPFIKEGPWFDKFQKLMDYTDLLIVDIKHIEPAKHRKLTGMNNSNILDMYHYLSKIGKPIWIRQVLVPGVTNDLEDLKRDRTFKDSLSNVVTVEVLPYHTMGAYKWKELGLNYPLEGIKPPDQAMIDQAEAILGAGRVCPDNRD